MGLFSTECSHCGSKEHASEDCPHGIFTSKCAHCGSRDHSSENCPQGFFSTKCAHCGSKEHASENCPHGIFSSKCAHCGSVNHSTENCPHGILSSKCSHCGSRDHSTADCPHGILAGSTSQDSGCVTAIVWLIIIAAVVSVVVWLAVNIVLPILLLNSAIILTIGAIVVKKYKKLFSALALVGMAYMLFDVTKGWFSMIFVHNVVGSPDWITAIVYINAVAAGISTWLLVQPIWNTRNEADKNKVALTAIPISLILITVILSPLVYHLIPNPFIVHTYQYKVAPGSTVTSNNNNVRGTNYPTNTPIVKPAGKRAEAKATAGGEPAKISDAQGYTNFRKGPGTNYDVVRKLYASEMFTVYPTDNKWWYMETKDGKTGYIYSNRIDLLERKFYIISVTATQTESDALREVKKLETKGYQAGHLWIPNYRSLSGANFYCVYIGPFDTQKQCEIKTQEYRKINSGAYGLLVSQDNKRVEIRGVGNVKVTEPYH